MGHFFEIDSNDGLILFINPMALMGRSKIDILGPLSPISELSSGSALNALSLK